MKKLLFTFLATSVLFSCTQKTNYELTTYNVQFEEDWVSDWCGDPTNDPNVQQIITDTSVQFRSGRVLINSKVSIAAHTTVGDFVSINRHVSIGHHTIIGDYCSINPGTNIAGNVTIGEGTTIGMGTNILHTVKIGKNSIIGAGSVVTKDIPDNVVAYGSPCRVIRENV